MPKAPYLGKSGNAITAAVNAGGNAVQVNGIRSPQALGLGVGHTCALMPDTSVQCWGEGDAGQDPADVADGDRVRLAHRGQARAQSESARDEQAEQRRERHHAEPADLDEDEDDDLTERRPEHRGVHHDVPGDAEGAGRGEQGFDERRGSAVDGDGKTEEKRAEGERAPEGQGDDPARGEPRLPRESARGDAVEPGRSSTCAPVVPISPRGPIATTARPAPRVDRIG